MADLFPFAVLVLVAIACWVSFLLLRIVLKEGHSFRPTTTMIRLALGLISFVAWISSWLPISKTSILAYETSRFGFAAAVFGWLTFETIRAWNLSFGSGRTEVDPKGWTVFGLS